MSRWTVSDRAQALLLARPWMLAALSGVFVAMIVALAADAGWDPTAVIGGGRRHAPLWLVAGIGLPFFGTGVVVGVVKQIGLVRRRRRPVPDASPDRTHQDGPGWLSRRADDAREREDEARLRRSRE
ncbi:hypothetical protein GSU68_02130 [Rathayibacter sp. VKM Ac-2759]|uniref:hypothetical protein n=1 Tax=Rathayibacter sp. VKM Ac-2759 TaxID=2609252 RepID=UPI001319166A|nr:hypothetical protein [Rathayibacter sp. VKM Ac-2759]QHC65497.1 hypothetical protein GSU68_02130 [Rathayibacter sp. VKM Ac-2759]